MRLQSTVTRLASANVITQPTTFQTSSSTLSVRTHAEISTKLSRCATRVNQRNFSSSKLVVDQSITVLKGNWQKASQIPQFCFEAALTLDQQGIFKGTGSIVIKSKVLPLATWDDTRIVEIFNANAVYMIGNQTAWHVQGFGGENNIRRDASGQLIPQGLEIWLHNDNERCPLNTMLNLYNMVYRLMINGWKLSNPKDHPDILHKKDANEYYLFIKGKTLIEEEYLIRFISSKLNMYNVIDCSDQWISSSSNARGYKFGNPYMWIKKTALAEVIDKFGFLLNATSIEDLSKKWTI